jgi:hypothetical protein
MCVMIRHRIDGRNPQQHRFRATLLQLHHKTTPGCAQHVHHACTSDRTRLHPRRYLRSSRQLKSAEKRRDLLGSHIPRISAFWCASCPLRAESGKMPSVIRHTEHRGKGRLQNGQAVASIRRNIRRHSTNGGLETLPCLPWRLPAAHRSPCYSSCSESEPDVERAGRVPSQQPG